MCGRSACTLARDDIQHACRHQTKPGGKFSKPAWISPPGGQSYQPSHNVCPGTHTPILLSKTHVDYEKARMSGKSEKGETETKMETDTKDSECPWVIQPMRWGLVPSWHSGETAQGVGYNMINARSDGILTKRTFKGPLEKGRRCVVLVDGYFEWHTENGKKQPHFVYFPHDEQSKESKEHVTEDGEEVPEGWEGRRLMTLAGLFDIWRPKDGSAPLYSYSIITVEAHKSVSWLHQRMPAVLNGEAEISEWLSAGEVPLAKAVSDLIQPKGCVTHHPVSSAVNNNKNKSDECTQKIDLEKIKEKEKASSNFMASWLSKGKKRKSTETAEEVSKDEGVSVEKKIKSEPESVEENV